MANTSHLPAFRAPSAKSALRNDRSVHAVRPVAAPAPVAAPPPPGKVEDIQTNVSGPRKLVRPTLGLEAGRSFKRREATTLLTHQASVAPQNFAAHDSSHAEAFYFQKQVQTQTLMVFVLEDGEMVEGYIEWYDRNAIKVKHSGRSLIYKSSIKYLYKAGEGHP